MIYPSQREMDKNSNLLHPGVSKLTYPKIYSMIPCYFIIKVIKRSCLKFQFCTIDGIWIAWDLGTYSWLSWRIVPILSILCSYSREIVPNSAINSKSLYLWISFIRHYYAVFDFFAERSSAPLVDLPYLQ